MWNIKFLGRFYVKKLMARVYQIKERINNKDYTWYSINHEDVRKILLHSRVPKTFKTRNFTYVFFLFFLAKYKFYLSIKFSIVFKIEKALNNSNLFSYYWFISKNKKTTCFYNKVSTDIVNKLMISQAVS